ncbi:MAG: FAD-dependent oxidoreductase [Actinomycetota bacterium]|nr:FAD-dependent oxidoreductase [Actinomycetota bacterium]
MRRIVVVGGGIAGVTAASTLRAEGWHGDLTVLSEEDYLPYSRVPLSKGVLAGTQTSTSATLTPLPDDVELSRGCRAVALHAERHVVELSDGTVVPYDGLVVATGSRARRLTPEGQRGELVIRTLTDVEAIAERVPHADSAVIVGGGFLGMEVASTLSSLGLSVTVIDRDPPLLRLLGSWLADLVVASATRHDVRFVLAPDGVELVGNPVKAVVYEPGTELQADLVISAVGDHPNVEWLETSGLMLAGGLVVDDHCLATPRIAGAGDVTVREASPGAFRRTPHWTNAVVQGQAAARGLLDRTGPAYTEDPYFWTEQFGLDIKMAGELPFVGKPHVLDGDPATGSALLQWRQAGRTVAAASVNYRVPVVKLKRLAAPD